MVCVFSLLCALSFCILTKQLVARLCDTNRFYRLIISYRIIYITAKLDPSLQQAARALKRQFTSDSVKDSLLNRPSPSDLVIEGVMREDLNSMAPALQSTALVLENKINRLSLKHQVKETQTRLLWCYILSNINRHEPFMPAHNSLNKGPALTNFSVPI